ncbi:hypothetical protein D3C84_1269580 [compost metagenome]
MQQQDFPLDQVRNNVLPSQKPVTEPAQDPEPTDEEIASAEEAQKALTELFFLKAVQAARTEAIQ